MLRNQRADSTGGVTENVLRTMAIITNIIQANQMLQNSRSHWSHENREDARAVADDDCGATSCA